MNNKTFHYTESSNKHHNQGFIQVHGLAGSLAKLREIFYDHYLSLKLWIRLVIENLRWHSQMTT